MKRKLVFILVALIALVPASYFAVASTFGKITPDTNPPVRVQVEGSQIYVPVGEPVYIYIKLYSYSGASGTVTVKVKKDLIYYTDAEYTTLEAHVDIKPGEEKEVYLGGFVASDETCYGHIGSWCFPGSFREYFIQVYFNGRLIYNPVSVDGREFVRTYRPAG